VAKAQAPVVDRTTQPKKRAFLAAYAKSGNISAACRAAEIERRTYYLWTEHDAEFAAAAKMAYAEAGDYLEMVALERATVGHTTVKEVWEEGVLVKREVTTGVSDTMLAMMLNGAKPEKYKQRAEVSHTGPAVKTLAAEAWDAL
jgi:hypothetical protein